MAGELHEISAKIGALDAKADASAEALTLIFAKLDAVHHEISMLPHLEKRIGALEPVVAQHEQDRQQAVARAGLLATGAGMIGAAIPVAWEFIKTKLGGHS